MIALHSPRRAVRIGRRTAGALVAIAAVVIPVTAASAHTETDFVAVPAGSTATVTFEPEHGCGDSPTIDMKVQAPVAGATAVELAGWTATSTPDAEGNTVLQWTGGSQPAHESGAFQVQFVVPDAVGTLLSFPAVQTCANGEQEAWIETDPGAESPAPQLLVLAAGSAPAATLDDVPAEAPGRDLLAALTESDDDDDAGPAAATSTAPTSATPAPPTSTGAATTAPVASTSPASPATPPTTIGTATTAAAPTTTTADSESSGTSRWVIILLIVAVVAIGAVAIVVLNRYRGDRPGE